MANDQGKSGAERAEDPSLAIVSYSLIKYFPSLNGLRFLAAFLVVMHHSESIKKKNHIPDLYGYTLFRNGSTAVSFFFVLSGFLITYLLLKELAQSGSVSIPQFYKRRVLRIWPLYYLLVILGLSIPLVLHAVGIPYKEPFQPGEVWYYYVFFLPFLVNLLFPPGLLDPLWSIGVEELFYLFWAPLVKLFNRWLPWVLAGVVVLKTGLLLWAEFNQESRLMVGLIKTLQFEAMAIGGLGAYWLYHRKRPIHQHFLFSRGAQLLFYTLLLVKVLGFTPIAKTYPGLVFDALLATPVLSVLLVSSLFLWLILNTAINPQAYFRLESRPMRFLGEISYGIYMYHLLVVSVIALGLKGLLGSLPPMAAFAGWYALVGGGTIVVAWLSKRYFEDFFLKWK